MPNHNETSGRRSFLKYALSGASTVGAPTFARDYHGELGVKPFINAIGPYSSLGGEEMWPEVIDAMDYAVQNKADMEDLHDAVGKRIAELLGCEYAAVTAGATSAIILGTAGCMSGLDKEILETLPHPPESTKTQVILQSSHKYLYDRALRVPGAELIFVDTEDDLIAAINEKTAMMFYVRKMDGQIPLERWIHIAKDHNIPTLCDAATTVPPIQYLLDTVKLGFDMICLSGGKGLRGPYSAGLLLGKKDLIDAAKANGSPNHRAVGRSMKVAPEEYLGMMVAVERSLEQNEAADMRDYMRITGYMAAEINALPGVTAEVLTADAQGMEPYVNVNWDQDIYKISKDEMKLNLRNGDPCIELRAMFLSFGELHITGHMLKPGEEKIIVRRVKEILKTSKGDKS
ncbi:aminotransferase class V-fold PLP-dependent enzyme [Pseudemcibacter aquimaris]|uniref:aminotransferase class V-fold PLP-dependent enzyme n=1 Tax=Pseudemcibacter aquimaris TaxID=2857064 RepID=UPI0020124B2E|nr:aminotransferase class V-fold PLP-dependent enzyme [Pseudemcibacter aquimaris]MCC3861739.1 aminotransferase class V-fold PLP-dependent enzyme [Pseudemcibacter aquimaris]WDU58508.1 aminotransferase class V-fold PLP-dependent enzyme [Pseudemcibacter aquimaris]